MDIYRLPAWVKTPYDIEMYHSGIKGMIHGRRRYQNKDGSLTPLGRIHYGVGQARQKGVEVARNVDRATTRAAERTGQAVSKASDYLDENLTAARSMRDFDTSSRRASNLGEVGTGVRRRSQINGRHSINYDERLDTISPSLTLKGKNTVTSSGLRDATMDSIREREVTQIGRFYTEQFYKGTGGYGVSSYNYSDSGVLKNYYARQGKSQTGGESPYSYHKNTYDTLQTRNVQDNEYESRKTLRKMKDNNASKEEIRRVQDEIDDKYDKEWDEIQRKYGTRRR